MADEGLTQKEKIKLLADTFSGVGSRLELAAYFEPEKPLWQRASETAAGKPIEWIRRTLYFDAVLGVCRATWSNRPDDPCLQQLVQIDGCHEASDLFDKHLSRDGSIFKRFDIFRNRYAAHLSPMPNTLKKHIREGGDEQEFEHFLTFEVHDGFRKALVVFQQLRSALGYDWIDFEEFFLIARAQSDAFVSSIGTPSDYDFDEALKRFRPAQLAR